MKNIILGISVFLILLLTLNIQNDSPANAPTAITISRGDSLIFVGQGSLGNSVSSAGDVNADGYDDIIIGDPSLDGGRAYIHFGSTILDTIPELVLRGPLGSSKFGLRLCNAGDINNDGFDDVAVADDEYLNNTGRVYIFLGGENMNGEPDIILTGQEQGIHFGNNVELAGDVNGDGYSDIVAGAYGFSDGRGRVEIHFGGINMDTIPDVVLVGENTNNYLNNVSGAGDVNNDGFDDVIAGAWGYNSSSGRAYILFGSTNMNNSPDVVLTGSIAADGFGLTVADAGDVNGDSYSDVIVGTNVKGRAFIFYGGASMNNTVDVNLVGPEIGYQASTVGDINNDGYDDVIIGAFSLNSNSGSASVFLGGSNMNGASDMIYYPSVGGYYGYSLSHAGDVNRDGFADFVIGSPAASPGRAYLFYNLQSNPELILPENNAANINLPISFAWHSYTSALTYRIEIANDSLFRNLVYLDSTLTDTSASVANLDILTKYYWRVGAKNSQGLISYSDVWKFTTSERPPITLIEPTNGSTNNSLELTFLWRDYQDASSYRILISLDSAFYNVIFIDSVFYDTSISIEGFSYATDYYWKVGVADSTGITSFSPIWKFTTLLRPIVELVSPMNDSLNTPLNVNFSWSMVPYGVTYRIQLSSDSNFINLVANYPGLTDTFKAITGLNHLTRYFWRVGAKELSGPTYYSSYKTFTTMPQLRLNVTVLMEGMYFPLFNQLSRRDSVRVILRASYAPYSVVDSATAVIDSLNFTGNFVFPRASAGRYYIVVKHFNCVETWSRAGGEELIGGITNSYNFTTSASQAYGSNMKLKSGKYCLYSGDVNQSGFIDGTDLAELDNAAYNLLSGRFMPTDLNGDNFTDGTDFVIGDNNRSYIGVITP